MNGGVNIPLFGGGVKNSLNFCRGGLCKKQISQIYQQKLGGFEETAEFFLYKIAYTKLRFSLQLLLLQQSQFCTSS